MTRDPMIDGARRRTRRAGSRPRSPGRLAAVLLPALLVLAVPGLLTGPASAALSTSGERGTGPDAFRPTFDAAPRPTQPEAATRAAPETPRVPALTLPGAWPAVEVRTLLVGFHLLGLCLGLGGATMLDFWILRWMRWGYLPDDVMRTFAFIGKAVSAGLVLLWLSGAGFLVLYGLCDPARLANPKILAKLVIVAALTVNGIVVHRLVLPYVAQARGMPLFDGFRRPRRLVFILSGALSGVSWYGAFALGLLREFNGRVPALTLLGIWLILVLLATIAMDAALLLSSPARAKRAAAP